MGLPPSAAALWGLPRSRIGSFACLRAGGFSGKQTVVKGRAVGQFGDI